MWNNVSKRVKFNLLTFFFCILSNERGSSCKVFCLHDLLVFFFLSLFCLKANIYIENSMHHYLYRGHSWAHCVSLMDYWDEDNRMVFFVFFSSRPSQDLYLNWKWIRRWICILLPCVVVVLRESAMIIYRISTCHDCRVNKWKYDTFDLSHQLEDIFHCERMITYSLIECFCFYPSWKIRYNWLRIFAALGMKKCKFLWLQDPMGGNRSSIRQTVSKCFSV